MLVLLRRAFLVAVTAYLAAMLTRGGHPSAERVFLLLTGSGLGLLLLHTYGRSPRIRSKSPRLRAAELVAWNLALTLVLAELGLRGLAAWSGQSLLLSDTLAAHQLIPGHDYGHGLRGNRLGYPGPDWPAVKPPGVRRVAALGDSFAVGPAVPFAANYLTLLGEWLPATEVYNFGVSGAGPREYAHVLGRDAWACQPDLVLVSVFVGNDVTETLATPRHLDPRQHALYWLATRGAKLLRARANAPPAPAPPDRLTAGRLAEEAFLAVEARRLAVCVTPVADGLEKKWRKALGHLGRVADSCRARGVPVAVILIPDEFQVNPAVRRAACEAAGLNESDLDRTLPQRRLQAFCAGRGVPCLDLLPFFEGVPDAYAPRDTHWNATGNRVAAERVCRWVQGEFAE